MSAPVGTSTDTDWRHTTVLHELMRQRNITGYQQFRREYDRVARRLDRNGTWRAPSPATWSTWRNIPAPPRDRFHRQVLESMFPGWTSRQLFTAVELIPNLRLDSPPKTPPPPQRPETPTQPSSPQDPAAPTTPQELGALLRHYRTTAEVTLQQLAAECLIHYSLVQKVEVGTRNQPRRFWAEVDVMLAADGELLAAFDHYQQVTQTPPRPVRVLARGVHRNPVRVHDTISPDDLRLSRAMGPIEAMPRIEASRWFDVAQKGLPVERPNSTVHMGIVDMGQPAAWEMSR